MTPADQVAPATARDHATVARRTAVLYSLAILSLATAVIHFAVSGEHFAEYWMFGVFMLVAAWAQLSWAVLAVARPARWLLWSGIVVNTGIVAVYLVTRTVGDVVGPTPNAVEPVGFGDVLCTILEVLVAAGCCWLLAARNDQLIRRQDLVSATAAVGALTAFGLSVALVAGGPEMVMSMSASPAGLTTVSSVKLATASPAGPITMPNPNMQMAPGMKMASSAVCDTTPSSSQQKAAVRLVNAAWKGAEKYRSLAAAKAAGYRPITPPGRPVVHYLNVADYRNTVFGGPILDTTAPQSLVYANTPHGAVLAAAMYITAPGGATPQPGGCLTQWHVHTNLCLTRGLGVVGTVSKLHPACPAGSRNRVTPPMMHVWFVPIPGGPTAIDASDRQVVEAAMRVAGPRNGLA